MGWKKSVAARILSLRECIQITGMAIVITKVGGLFAAKLTPPHGRGGPWETKEPMDVDELVQELLSRGCHQTDIGDVLYEIDPELIGEN
jgi:hypothetical protein